MSRTSVRRKGSLKRTATYCVVMLRALGTRDNGVTMSEGFSCTQRCFLYKAGRGGDSRRQTARMRKAISPGTALEKCN